MDLQRNKNLGAPIKMSGRAKYAENGIFAHFARDLWKNGTWHLFYFRNYIKKKFAHSFGVFSESDLFGSVILNQLASANIILIIFE